MSKGVRDIYTIAETSLLLKKSKKTIYRAIQKMPLECVTEFVTDTINDKGVKVKLLTENGFQYLQELYKNDVQNIGHENNYDNSVVNSLLEQLKEKDIQIAEKDKQISLLLEQSKNYQILLQNQQMLSLPATKKSLFKRLFGKSEK